MNDDELDTVLHVTGAYYDDPPPDESPYALILIATVIAISFLLGLFVAWLRS